jgi:phage baseplate assembly protein W
MSRIDDFYLEDLAFSNDFEVAPNGSFKIISGIENLKQALFHRLITVRGSLAHRPNYGVGVQQYQNKVSSLSKQRELALEIKNQFEQDFRVDKLLSVSFKAEPSGVFIVQYKVSVKGVGDIEDTVNPFGDIEI